MLAYLARRWPERSTRFVGLPLILLALPLGIGAWHWRAALGQVLAAAAGIIGTASAVLPGRIVNILNAWRALREVLPHSTPAAAPVSTGTPASQKESTLMSNPVSPAVAGSLISTIKAKLEQVAIDTALQEIGTTGLAPEAQKVFSDIVTASKAPSVVSIITAAADAAQLLHDALAQVASLKAQPVVNPPMA